MARQPKSDAYHALTGTRPAGARIPESERLEPSRPKYPRNLSAAARAIFKRLCGQLESRRHLTAGDEQILYLFCVLHDRHLRALAKLDEEGEIKTYTRLSSNGSPVQVEGPNKWLRIAEVCESKKLACLVQLGLTPSARKSVRATAGAAQAPIDPFDQFLRTAPKGGAQDAHDDLADFDEEAFLKEEKPQ